MAHSARFIILCIVATLFLTSVEAVYKHVKKGHGPYRSHGFKRHNSSNTTSFSYSYTQTLSKLVHKRRTFPTNTSSMSVSQTASQSQTQTYSLSLSQSMSKQTPKPSNTTANVTTAPNTTMPNTTAPNTTAPTTTAAPNTTIAPTKAPNTTAPTSAPNTSAPIQTVAPFTFPPTAATPVPTPLPPGQTYAPPVPTAAPPQIVLVLNVTLDSFNQTAFAIQAAAVIGLSASNVIIYSVQPASIKVDFGFAGTTANGAVLTPAAIAAASNAFVANANSSVAFTKAFGPISSISTVTFTAAPIGTQYNWRQIEASPALTIPTLLLAAVISIASLLH